MAHSNVNIKWRQGEIVPKVVCFSTNEIVREKLNNMQIKTCFPQNKSKKIVIEKEEELWDVECKSACWEVFDPTQADNIDQSNFYIHYKFEF